MTSQLPLPVIVTDSREQTPLQFSYPNIKAGLTSGDYSIQGLEDYFCVERKSLADLYGSLTSGRERFTRELHRLRAYSFRRLLVIGSEAEIMQGSSRAKGLNPKSIIHSLYAIEARLVPVVFSSSPEAAASLIERWAFWYAREHHKTAKALQNY